MRIFVAGASGVMGARLVPLLVEAGHDVVAMTRTEAKRALLEGWGATAVVGDVFDRDGLVEVVVAARPDAVVHQLTDLPDDAADLGRARAANARIREEGTANLVAAATAAGATRLVAQSIAWLVDGVRPPSVVTLERLTRDAGGTVVRYGQWYGPGTYHAEPPAPPRIHVDTAARCTVAALDLPPGTYVATDDGVVPAGD